MRKIEMCSHRLILCLDASPPETLPAGAALPTSVVPPTEARDQDEVGRRNSVGKAKGKGKKSDNSLHADSDLEVTKERTTDFCSNISLAPFLLLRQGWYKYTVMC